jgi:hypothetical protein
VRAVSPRPSSLSLRLSWRVELTESFTGNMGHSGLSPLFHRVIEKKGLLGPPARDQTAGRLVEAARVLWRLVAVVMAGSPPLPCLVCLWRAPWTTLSAASFTLNAHSACVRRLL